MRNLSGMRFAVAGLGVSGRAASRAVKSLGGEAVALDQKPADNDAMIRTVEELQADGIEVVTGWHGRLDPKEWDVLVVSPGFPVHHPVLRDMEGKVWGEIELAYRIAQAPIYATTGTNGKSTTVTLNWLLLHAAGVPARLCGNISGSGYPEMPLTEAALLAGPDEVLVAEVSSFQLENVEQFRPKGAAITNITPDHLDRHPSFEDYYQTKLKLFRTMGPGDTIIVNLAGETVPLATAQQAAGPGSQFLGFDPTGASAIPGRNTRRDGDELFLSGMRVPIADLPVPGEHFVANVMMAWEMASLVQPLGQASMDALLSFRGLDNRMEMLGAKGGIRVINNSMCTNPAAVIASSSSLAGPQKILIGGNTKGLDFSPLCVYLKGSAHSVYLFGPEPERMNEVLGGGWPIFASMKEAFVAAVGESAPGETVMLAPGCASAEPYANFRERGQAFRDMAKEWLEG